MGAVEAKNKALSLIGQGYIYGAKGQICSPEFRQMQADQYPDQADMILGKGAKWDGKPVWDCAQLTRTAAKAGGVALVSGATSQWTKTDWQEQGEIADMPEGEVLFLYKRQKGSTTTMQHTGVALGDGMSVHARGTEYGVVLQAVAEYPWTHWARPVWPDEKEVTEVDEVLYKATVTAPSGNTVNVRLVPDGEIVDRLAIGSTVNVVSEVNGWSRIYYEEKAGWMKSAFLQRAGDREDLILAKLDEILMILKK